MFFYEKKNITNMYRFEFQISLIFPVGLSMIMIIKDAPIIV